MTLHFLKECKHNSTDWWFIPWGHAQCSTTHCSVYIGKSSTTYCLTKLVRLSSPLWTQSATTGSLKLPRLKNPWSHGEANSSKKVWNKGVLIQNNWNFRRQEPFWWFHRPALPFSRLPPCLGCSWTPFERKSLARENLFSSVSCNKIINQRQTWGLEILLYTSASSSPFLSIRPTYVRMYHNLS